MMIRVEELRVDNVILFKEWGEGKGKIGQMKRGDFGRFNSEEYHPVLITPEWLERCGFNPFIGATIDDNKYYLQVGNNLYLNQYVRSGNWCVEPEGWNNEQTCWSQPQFVHQLQNLFFALTGEELNVKL